MGYSRAPPWPLLSIVSLSFIPNILWVLTSGCITVYYIFDAQLFLRSQRVTQGNWGVSQWLPSKVNKNKAIILVYCEIVSEQASQLNQRRDSPETGKENMQVCPAMTHSRLNTRSPWIQDSESSALLSQIFRRLVHAEKQSTALTASAETRHNSVTSEALECGGAVWNVICVLKSHVWRSWTVLMRLQPVRVQQSSTICSAEEDGHWAVGTEHTRYLFLEFISTVSLLPSHVTATAYSWLLNFGGGGVLCNVPVES